MKKSRVTINCKQCQKTFDVMTCLKDKAKFCSLICKGKYQTIQFKGKNNPNYRGGTPNCTDCNQSLPHRYLGKKTPRCLDCFHKFAVGQNAGNYSGKYTLKSVNGRNVPACMNCGGATADTCSILCRKCYRGKLSSMWRGGTSTLQTLIRALPENRQWIKQNMYRDNYTCIECGIESSGKNLQVHHIKQFALILKERNIKSIEEAKKCEELWDTDNGITLCKDCHKLTESFNKKLP